MNWPHIHLLVNHVPILGGIFAFLLLAYAWVRGDVVVIRLSLGLFVLFTLACIAVFFTGDPAAHAVDHQPGFPRDLIRAHDDAAGQASTVFFVAGLLALGGLIGFRKRPIPPRWYLALMLVVGLANSVTLARVGLLGGQIRHSEIRPGATFPSTSGAPVTGEPR
jgi:hypothetical protein